MASPDPARILELLRELKRRKPWVPLPGPQTMAYESTAQVIGFGGSAGGGKGLALDTPLPTPTGWTTMGAVGIGDFLIDERGNPCEVVAVSDISNRPCFRLVFDDGAEIVADDVHRWVTFDAKELSALTRKTPEWRAARRAKRKSMAKATTSPARLQALSLRNSLHAKVTEPPSGTMRDTMELYGSIRTVTGRCNHAIALQGKLELPEANLPIPPYTLGALLGDGTSRNGQLTGKDAEVWERIESEGFEVRHYQWSCIAHNVIGLKTELRALGVLENKHIPEIYLRGSYEQRLALLRGLMDTDGHAALDGGCEFDNTNERLAIGVLELVDSLGIKATLQKGKARLNGRIVGDKWRVKFTTSVPVFGLERKLARLNQTTRRTSRFRYLVSCEPVESVFTKCIAVNSASRQYLAGRRMVPTHNTDLACGKALTKHRKVMMLRRVGTELTGIEDRLEELIGSKNGYNGQKKIWRTTRPDNRSLQIEFASLPNAGDERGFQGRPHDFLVFDEAANFLEQQVRFLLGWLRTTIPDQPCQALLTFNPPTSAEGRWIIEFFAPWIDDKHPNPARPGEIRWFAMIDGKDTEVADGNPFKHGDETIVPMSRTFIPSRVTDNPYLMGTGYMATLQALPEPLRSQMLNGDFKAGMEDDPWQVIPTAWVDMAVARWKDLSPKPPMDSIGVDVARGGKDNTIIARRHGMWFDRALVYPGAETPNGPATAGLAIAAKRDAAPIHIDVIGVGASPFDFLVTSRQQTVGVNVAEKATRTDRSGRLRFHNMRSQLWWEMREALDPENNTGIALPDDPKLRADLCAPRWELRAGAIFVESREDIIKRIGRSPDWASAYILALIDTMKEGDAARLIGGEKRSTEYDPLTAFDRQFQASYTRDHNPFR